MESEALEPIISKNQSQADNDNDNLKDKINNLLDEYGYPREVEINLCPPYPQEPMYKTVQLADELLHFLDANYCQCDDMYALIKLYTHLKLCIGNDMIIKSVVSTPKNEYKKNMVKNTTIDGAATKIIMDSTYNAIIKYDQECGNLWTKYLLKKDTSKGIELTDDDLDEILEYEKEWSKKKVLKDSHAIGQALLRTYYFLIGYYRIFTSNKNGKPKQKDLAFLYDWCVIHGKLPPLDGANYEDKYNKVKYLMNAFEKARIKYGIGGVPKGYFKVDVARITFLH